MIQPSGSILMFPLKKIRHPSNPVAGTDSVKVNSNSTQPAPAVTAASAPAGNAAAATTTTTLAKKGGKFQFLLPKSDNQEVHNA
jgi:hypothetical protein